MSPYLDHIGIAVRPNSSLAKALAVLGIHPSHQEEVKSEKVSTEFFPLPLEQTKIELLHPLETDSVVAKFLEKTGRDGIHHLSFRVHDIRSAMGDFERAGFRLVYEEPRIGAHGCLVNFIHPQSTGGVLLEISQGGS
jgi:methylmalonyl-CoA epimerase